MFVTLLAVLFTIFSLIVVVFQWLLFFKKPWGEYTMGGIYPGVLPKPYRIAALIQSFLITFNIIVVLNHVDLVHFLSKSFTNGWLWVIMIMMGLSTGMNLVTKSHKERNLWAPIAFIVFVCSVLIYSL
jgi:hypothetical protein